VPLGVLGTISDTNTPQYAFAAIAIVPHLEIRFDRVKSSRKYWNLIAKPACSVAIGWAGGPFSFAPADWSEDRFKTGEFMIRFCAMVLPSRLFMAAACSVFAASQLWAQAPLDSGPIRHVAAGRFVFVVKGDGSVVGWGTEADGLAARAPSATARVTAPIPIDLPGKVRQMAVGESAAYALLEDGTVIAWGSNYEGQLGNGGLDSRSTPGINPKPSFRPVAVAGLTEVVQISAAGRHALALRKDGTVYAWGSRGTIIAEEIAKPGVATGPFKIAGLENIVQVAAARDHNLVLTRDGDVYAWGENTDAQLGLETSIYRSARPVKVQGLGRTVSIAAGGTGNLAFSGAVRDDGTVWMWGSNQSATMGNGLRSGGRGAVGDLNWKPVAVKGVANAKTISAGDGHVAVLLRDGTLRLWGHDGWGQIGVGTSSSYHESPMKPAITNVAAVFLAAGQSYAVRLDGTLWRWGAAPTYGGGEFTRQQRVPTLTPLP
jgi:alpha-tubulin suppressor-like RCC1 family protein